MIVKILYQFNENNKRIITGLIENDDFLAYDPLYEYEMVLEHNYPLKEGERKISNFGKHYHAVFKSGNSFNYLNFNDFMLKVKLNLTDNLAFSSSLSKEMLSSILENTNYFDEDLDLEYVDSGLSLNKDLEFKDIYDGWFRKVTDDVYCQLNEELPLFVGKKNNNYYLTEDFKDAYKVSKRECRNLMITHKWITKNTLKKNVAFSHFNIFNFKNSYVFGGLNSYRVDFKEDTIEIERDFIPTTDYKLISDGERASNLRQICYLMKKELTLNEAYLRVNGKFLCEISKNKYLLTKKEANATKLDLRDIDILKETLKLYLDNPKFDVVYNKSYFLYSDGNSYSLSKEIKEDLDSKIISKDTFEKFIKAFNKANEKEYILISNNHYVEMDLKSNLEFELKFHQTALNATKFTLDEAKALEALLEIDIKPRKLEVINTALDLYNIKFSNEPLSIYDSYNKFLDDVEKSNYKFKVFYEVENLMKTVSRVGAYEHLKRFFLKAMWDSYVLFNNLIENYNVSNILLVGSTSTADIIGLSNVLSKTDKKVNLTIIETTKWGYYPLANLSRNINFKGAYRIPLWGMPKEFINQFDLIYLGKNFKGAKELESFVGMYKEYNHNLIFAHTNLINDYDLTDDFLIGFKGELRLNRKYIKPMNLENYKLSDLEITDYKSSYFSLVELKDGTYIDLLIKKTDE